MIVTHSQFPWIMVQGLSLCSHAVITFEVETESHCKASLIKIPDVIFMNTMFLNSCAYTLDPFLDNSWIPPALHAGM